MKNSGRTALISDIHSNYISLEVLYYELKTENIDNIIFLGDYLTDCPYPMKTVEIIKALKDEYNSVFIRGNREDYLLDYYYNKPDWSSPSGRGSLKYTYDNTDLEFVEFFIDMPLSIIDENHIYCHGSPEKNTELLHWNRENTDNWLLKTDLDIIGGHTHVQGIYTKHGRTIINPGSVGIALGKGKEGNYAIMENKNGEIRYELKSYPYDYMKLYKEFLKSNLFEIGGYFTRAIYRNIVTGKPITMFLLRDAFNAARAEGIEGDIIPESYWARAAEKYGLTGDLND
ncbi:metallophosphoesterase family protein [Microaceticoccus formicicus]|uniref:metallophosphoesterase family protein n=1 Tax=Microaceticoccus formicicus TaxID=3118105 RepID=UPI003CD00ED5|nr:metallophosphoesterase family protein [Peptoniphilaceae bacterium AMB_02]